MPGVVPASDLPSQAVPANDLPSAQPKQSSLLHDVGQLAAGAASSVAGAPGDAYSFLANRLLADTSRTNPAMGGKPVSSPISTEAIENFIFGPPGDKNDAANRTAGEELLSSVRPNPKAIMAGLSRLTGLDPKFPPGSTAKTVTGAVARLYNSVTGKTPTSLVDALRKQTKDLGEVPALAAKLEADQYRAQNHNLVRDMESANQNYEALGRQYERQGASHEVAQALVQKRVQQVADTRALAQKLSEVTLAKPGIDANVFGADVRQQSKALFDKHDAIREQQAGFPAAIESAGRRKRVNTGPILDYIDGLIATSKNPGLRSALGRIRGEFAFHDSLGRERAALTIAEAQDLKKTLDEIVNSKIPSENVNPTALRTFSKLRDQLVKIAESSWTQYKEARQRYSTLSSDLDIVEEGGALGKVLEKSDYGRNWALSDAQVTGELIKHANAGHPVISRLMKENPHFQDSARMYFSWDLFGKGTMPSDAAFAGWLKRNYNALNDAKLLGEFHSIRGAQNAAKRAIEIADGHVTEAQIGERAAAKAKAQTEKALSDAKVQQEKAGRAIAQNQAKVDRLVKMQRWYRQFVIDIEKAPASKNEEQVTKIAHRLASDMHKKGFISDANYSDILDTINQTRGEYKDRALLLNRLKRIALGTFILASGATGIHYWYVIKNNLGL